MGRIRIKGLYSHVSLVAIVSNRNTSEYRSGNKWITRTICIIRHDFYHSQDTRLVLQEANRMQPGARPFSSYAVESDITELYPLETFRRTLRHVLKCARDIDWVTWRRISIFSYVGYELQRTTVSVNDCENTS